MMIDGDLLEFSYVEQREAALERGEKECPQRSGNDGVNTDLIRSSSARSSLYPAPWTPGRREASLRKI